MIKSKLIQLILLFALTFIGCKARIPQNNIETIKFEDNNTLEVLEFEEIEELADTSDFVEDLIIDVKDSLLVLDSIDIKKEKYKVAIILPFMEDSVRRAWSKSKDDNFTTLTTSKESEISASFLEGMMMAMKGVTFNSKFEIEVFDNNDSETRTEQILQSWVNEDFDIIIGPYDKAQVALVAAFAKEKNMLHLSPFSPSKSAAMNYENYFMVEPSLEQHLLSMINYGLDSLNKVNIRFLYPNSVIGKNYAKLVTSYIDTLNAGRSLENKINFASIEIGGTSGGIGSLEISKYTDNSKENLIIVNSFDEDFLHKFLRQLGMVSNSTKITCFGMPGWENSKILRLEHLNEHQIHFTKSMWIDNEALKIKNFETLYKTKYLKLPNEYVYVGYDIANVLLKLIDEKGLNLSKNCINQELVGLARNYSFKRIYGTDVQVQRIENTSLRIYKIVDFEEVLVK